MGFELQATEAHHNLFGLSKVIHRVRIELHDSNRLQRSVFLWDDLRGVENIESESECLIFLDDLHGKLPFRAIAGLDGVPEVVPVKVRILASDVLCFIPYQTSLSLLRLPVPFDQFGITLVGDEAECVDAKTVLIKVSLK